MQALWLVAFEFPGPSTMTNVDIAGVAFGSHGTWKGVVHGQAYALVIDVARGQLATVDRNGYIGRSQAYI